MDRRSKRTPASRPPSAAATRSSPSSPHSNAAPPGAEVLTRMFVEHARFGPTIRLVPHSGIQFVEYAFNVDAVGRLSRRFIERQLDPAAWIGGKSTYRLVPAWDETDPGSGVEESAGSDDRDYTISERAALEIFREKWVPVPMLRVKAGTEGGEELDLGPTNWARVRVTEVAGRATDSPI